VDGSQSCTELVLVQGSQDLNNRIFFLQRWGAKTHCLWRLSQLCWLGQISEKEDGMIPQGIFVDPGFRGYGSAEVQVLRQEPLDLSEVQRVLDRDENHVTVLTCCGKPVVLRLEEAKKLGL